MIQKDKARVGIFGKRFRARASQLTPGPGAVASYISEHRGVVLERTTTEIAATLNTSDATTIRTIQTLGFAGLRDLKHILEQWLSPALGSDEKMFTTVSSSTSDVNTAIDFVLEGRLYTYNVLSEPENRHALAQAVALLVQARQVTISGTDASGILADYTTRLFNRIGLPATTLNRTGIDLTEQLIALQHGDVLVMMAQKSAHREGLVTLHEAGRLGILVTLLANALDLRFSKGASIVIHVPRGDEKGETPLHGTVLSCLKMIVWSMASAVPQHAVKTIKRINGFYQGLKTGEKDGQSGLRPVAAPTSFWRC